MYSFALQQNKESISVSIAPKDDHYEATVTLVGMPDSRLIISGGKGPHYVKNGELKFNFATDTVVMTWGVVGAFYDNRRITVDVKAGTFKYEPWGYAPAPKYHDYAPLFTHDLMTNPSPSYKLFKYKGELKAKLQ
jgi:hypothetical protein